MKIKIKINRLCLILICAGLLRGDSNNERKYNHYPEPVNIIKKKNRFYQGKAAPRATSHQGYFTQQCAVNDK